MCFGTVIVDFLEWGHTVNPAHCVETLKKQKARIARERPEEEGKILLLTDSARPHTCFLVRETIAEFGRTVVSCLPCSSDPAPSDFYLFGLMMWPSRETFLQ
jgi:hypothetical protein